MIEKKTFDEKINMDTATSEKIKETNDKLSDYLKSSGEKIAGEQVDFLIKNQKSDEPVKTPKSPTNEKLLTVNKKILNVLEKIQEDMFDEQDTSIKKTSKIKGDSQTIINNYYGDGEESTGMGEGLGFGGGGYRGSKKGSSKKTKPKPKPKPKVSSTGPNKSSDTKTKPKPKVSSKSGKGLLKGAGRILGKGLPILAAGMAVYDGVQGWNNADQIFDKKEGEKADTTEKASAAAGSILQGLSFGLLDGKDISKGINNTVGGNDTITKFEKMGIIDHDLFGDSDIEDWDKLGKLKSSEIQNIIDIDDWSKTDHENLKQMKAIVELRESQEKGNGPEKEKIETEGVSKKSKIDFIQTTPYNIKNVSGISPTIPVVSGSKPDNPNSYSSTDLFKLYNTELSDLEGINPNMLSNLKSMAAEYFDTYCKKIQINSAYRSFEEQAKLKEKYGSKAAKPGSSMHNYGLAVDMNTSDANNAIKAGLFEKYGFVRPVSGETWHVEPKGIDRAGIRAQGMKSGATQMNTQSKPQNVANVPEKTYSEGGSDKDLNKTAEKSPTSVVKMAQTTPLSVSKENKQTDSNEKINLGSTKAEVNKEQKLMLIKQSSSNLVDNTKQYDKAPTSNVQPVQTSSATTVINKTNTVQDHGQGRLLNFFS
jgi:hypothetical protein